MKKVNVNITGNDSNIPVYQTEFSAGADLKADIKHKSLIPSGESALIPTGIKLEIPEGYEVQIRPRSGLAFKNKITVLNSPGTIDSDYRGEINVLVINHGKLPVVIEPGMRIAQMVLAPVVKANFIKVSSLTTKTSRDIGGFGSTGTE